MRRSSIPLVVALLCSAVPLRPREDAPGCGTHSAKGPELAALHRSAAAGRAFGEPRLQAIAPRALSLDIGDLAVLADAGDIVAPPVLFNLAWATVSFVPAAAGAARYRFETGPGSYDADAASFGTQLKGLTDDDAVEVALPFAFPFFGSSYGSFFVNSDGNLTFGAADASSSARSLGRLTSGPPRLAPFFHDLDPSHSVAGIKVLSSATRVVVSWVAVPEYSPEGAGAQSTFQVRLFPSGRIEFAYSDVGSNSAVVGISPGGFVGSTSLVSFRLSGSGEYSGTVAERFTNSREIDIYTAAARFYQTHEDAYDYLVFFNNMGVGAAPGALAYEATVRTLNRTGYGEAAFDTGSQFGSPRRLQSVLNMGPLSQYPASPDSRIPNRGQATGDTGLTILGHEAGHLFLAFASARDPLDYANRVMLKPDGAHWSFNFNSEASLLEGNRIRDNGNGTFTTVGTVEGYSPLDQYLMGLVPADEVPSTYVVVNSSIDSSEPPSARSITFLGTRRNITVDEIVRTEGLRAPNPTVSQRRFRCAFVLIVAAGSNLDEFELEKLDNYRARFEDGFSQWTGGKAAMETTLRRGVQFSLAPSAGVLMGRTATGTLTLQTPAATPITFSLARQQAAAFTSSPASVTIPAGAASATFEIAGLAPGVDELLAQPSNPAYETAAARVQVSASSANLRLSLVSPGDPVRLRVDDRNNVPYPGVPVLGSASPAAALSDTDGRVNLARDGTGGLTAHLEGVAPATVDGIVNAASYLPSLAPGGFAAIFGRRLGDSTVGGLPPYPADLNGVRVWVDAKPAALHYASDGQVNLVVPPRAEGGTRDFLVSSSGGSAALLRRPLLDAAPGIFATVRNSNYLEIYCTGLGDGLPVTVYLGGRRLTPSWSGPHPSYPGLYQVNVEIPAGLTGDQPLSLEVSSQPSNEVRVAL